MPFLHICEQLLAAGENIRIRDQLRFLDSSRDKEHDDALVLYEMRFLY